MCNEKSVLGADVCPKCFQCNNNNVYQGLKNAANTKKVQKRKRILAQMFVTGAVMLSSASCGMPVGYSAVLLPQLSFANDSMRIDDEIGSWIASIHSAATPIGSLISGLLMDRFGRKLALQIASTPLIVGWLLIAFAGNHTVLLIGRMVAGVSAGLTAAAGQVLIGEISEPHLRGILSSVPFASYSFGILLVYAFGSFLPWRYVAGLSIILPLMSFFSFIFLPESPVWLIRNTRIDDARKSLLWLRGGDAAKANVETDHLLHRLETELHQIQKKPSFSAIFQPEVLKPLIIINVFNILQILSGTYLIVFYAVDILKHVQGGKTVDHFLTAVLTAGVRFVFSIIASALLVSIGRRTLTMISGLGSACSTILLSIFMYQNCTGFDFIPAILVLLYVATNTMGFMILPGVLLSELFPAKVRGLAGGLSFMLFNMFLFTVAKVFPFVKNILGMPAIFCFFGCVSLFASVFLYLTLPETKSKTLSEIEDYFQHEGFLWARRRRRQDSEGKDSQNETEKLNV